MAQEEVSVSVNDLEVIRAALNSVWHHQTVLDLADQYRKMSSRPQASAMTKAVQGALDLVDELVHQTNEEEDEDDGQGA